VVAVAAQMCAVEFKSQPFRRALRRKSAVKAACSGLRLIHVGHPPIDMIDGGVIDVDVAHVGDH
jgi:hypothetical protein